jgi:hypothetical protein
LPRQGAETDRIRLDFRGSFTYMEEERTMSDTSMTQAEQALADDKMRAEIAKLIAETSRIDRVEIGKFNAEIAKLIAETSKINTENRWYLLIVGSGATLAIVAVARLFLGP